MVWHKDGNVTEALVLRFVSPKWAVAPLLVLAGGGCSGASPTEQDCTRIGCHSGIEVVLEEPPAGPFRIEAYVTEGVRYVFECTNPSGCSDPVLFPDFLPDRFFIEVITEAGTEFYDVIPEYEAHRPNGPDCPPTCLLAVVHLPSDSFGA